MTTSKRVFELDALRGLSLFGILLMNILPFSFPYDESFLPDKVDGVDELIIRIVTTLIISSFYPIFTFLFGYGLAIMFDHSVQRDYGYYPVIFRRLTFLLALGLIHGYFIFSGDILVDYAITGMIAVLLIKKRPKALFITAIVLFTVKIVLIAIPKSLFTWLNGRYDTANFTGTSISKFINTKQHGSYMSNIALNTYEKTMHILDLVTFGAFFEFLPYVLLGMVAQKVNLIDYIRNNQRKAMKWGCTFLIIGYLVKLPYAIDYANQALSTLSTMLGGPLVATGYVLLFIILCQKSNFVRFISMFKYPGKLSLTIYLTQSIIFTLIYGGLGFGFGLYDRLALYQSYMIAIVIFILQMILSYYYLKKFKKGPFEWIWRKFTCLK
ncbi:DUF418 domain-containing protein [Staphylococcus sp. HKU1]|uniref:DUF418 domain-containing protein n=1 Tax=Staphylococcus sp. HKU1 TaxID=3068989 RepID=UPI003AAE2337